MAWHHQPREPERKLRALSIKEGKGTGKGPGRVWEGLLPLGQQERLFARCFGQGAGQADGTFEQGCGEAVRVVFKCVDRLGHQ